MSKSKIIQIRNVPNALHKRLKVRVAQAGMSLSNYLLMEINEGAKYPTLAELCEQLHKREPIGNVDTARLLRMERPL